MTGILDRKSTVSPSARYEDLLRQEPGESHLLAIGFLDIRFESSTNCGAEQVIPYLWWPLARIPHSRDRTVITVDRTVITVLFGGQRGRKDH